MDHLRFGLAGRYVVTGFVVSLLLVRVEFTGGKRWLVGCGSDSGVSIGMWTKVILLTFVRLLAVLLRVVGVVCMDVVIDCE